MARLAKSLVKLREQVNARYPKRSKSSDGWIGDTAHAARKSDHNPDKDGVVLAIDLTHDPVDGFDAHKWAEIQQIKRDPRIKYVISRGRIFNSAISNGVWRAYSGSNPHNAHVHVSVVANPAHYDDARAWVIEDAKPAPQRQKNIIATVWNDAMGAYGPIDHSKPSVSLPAPVPRGTRVRVFGPKGSAVGYVTDKGPWYDGSAARPADEYWKNNRRPRAETDKRTNGAGIDLNPKMAELVGISGKGRVSWEFE